jgi:hypothetical protein
MSGVGRLIAALVVVACAAFGCEGEFTGPPDFGCGLPELIECERACDRYPEALACSTSIAPVERADCLRECDASRMVGGNRAALYLCIQDFNGNCAAVLACASTCQNHPGGRCDPKTREPCTVNEVCDAKTSTCVPIPVCQNDVDCSDGFSCKPYSGTLACYRGCSDGAGLPADELCQPTHACDEQTFLCNPWPCITSGAQLDCVKACASLASACAKQFMCNPAACAAQSGCMSDCTKAKASANPRTIATVGCLMLGHDCQSFGNCESVCAPDVPDGGTRD